MDALPALRIVDALGIYGESSDPVYPEKNLLPIWASRFDLHLEVLRPWPESAVAGQTDVVEILFAEPGGEFKQVDQRSLEGLITFPLKLELDNQHLGAPTIKTYTSPSLRRSRSINAFHWTNAHPRQLWMSRCMTAPVSPRVI